MDIEYILSRWEEWAAVKPKLLKPLGGHSNKSYLVQAGQEKFVIRINIADQTLGVDRQREIKVLNRIKGFDFSPTILAQNEHYMVTKFIEVEQDQALPPEEMAKLFKLIHGLSYTEGTVLNPFEKINDYLEKISEENQKLQQVNHSIQNLIEDSVQSLEKNINCFCHNDLLPENIMQTKQGIKIIDWEYAQLGNPLFDLAVYMEHMEYSDIESKRLLLAYDKTIDPALLTKWRLVVVFINLLWWKIKKPREDMLPGLLNLEFRLNLLS